MLTQQDIQNTAQKIVQQAAAPVRVVVFGSYGRGEATEDSDLDLLVVEESLEDFTKEYVSLRKAIGPIGVGVDLLLMSEKDYEQRKDWCSSPVYWAHREGKVVTAPEQHGEVESLLAAAKRDALAFDLLAAQPEAPTEVMFFLAQQSIEKTIKAMLAHRKVAYRKTHDLVELSALLSDDSLQGVLPEDLMIRLGPYAVEMRYVNTASPQVGVDEVKRAVAGVLAWAQRMLTS